MRFAYARLSTAEQARGLTLEGQIALLRDWGFDKLYQDLESGRKTDRTEFTQMINDARELAGRGEAVTIRVARHDRWARNAVYSLSLIEELEELGVVVESRDRGVISLKTTADFVATANEAILAELESRRISERLKRAFEYKRLKHQPLGNPPIGYRKNADKSAWELDPELSPVVRRWFDMRLSGSTLYQIEQQSIKDGHRRSRGALGRMFKHPGYCGHLRFSSQGKVKGKSALDKVIPNTHPALISEQEFRRLQRMAEENRRFYGKNTFAKRHPLSGIVRCAECGNGVFYSGKLGRKNNKIYEYYRCIHQACRYHVKGIRAADLEASVQQAIEDHAEEIAAMPEDTDEKLNPRIIELESRIKQLEPLKDEALIAQQIKHYRAEITQILEAPPPESKELGIQAQTLIGAPWRLLSDEDRRELYVGFVESVICRGRQVEHVVLKF